MYDVIVILIIIASLLLIGAVLIQNPKGGGLSQSFGGLSSQFMGVKRTTDFLEKSTWGLIGAVAILSLFTSFFINRNVGTKDKPVSAVEKMDVNPALPQGNPAPPPAQGNNTQAPPQSGAPAPPPAGNTPAPAGQTPAPK